MPDEQMGRDEFIRATFFSSDEEIAATARKHARAEKRRATRTQNAGLRALKAFAKAMQGVSEAERAASIRWLADKFNVRLR